MIGTRLPIGIQSFSALRAGEYAYVDKTAYISRLVRRGKYFFLARPRRFGKSLFVDTLACAFEGRRDFFKGLYLDENSEWDWTRKRTVLRIDWVITAPKTPQELKKRISEILGAWEIVWKILPFSDSPGARLHDLVEGIHEQTGQKVVVLVDEYDKPILDTIDTPGISAQMRDILKDFYGALKPLDQHLEFVFLTGVSKFAKAGIFSGLNNLNDITLDDRYSSICGYTQTDLETVFAPWLAGLDPGTVKAWYNGYSWGGESVYNPFDILFYFDKRVLRSFWFETGTPAFLVKLLSDQPRSIPDLDNFVAGEELLGSFDVDRIRPETMLFQAGYLTVKSSVSSNERGMRYTVGFPNREVRQSFSRLMLEVFGVEGSEEVSRQDSLSVALDTGDAEAIRVQLHALFASIPYNWYVNNPISRYEGFYASIVYSWFASAGFDVIPEDTTNKGRIDLTVKTRASIWLFEFKVKGFNTGYTAVPEAKSPLAQLLERDYAGKYRADGRPIHLAGIAFDPISRQVVGWEAGMVDSIRL